MVRTKCKIEFEVLSEEKAREIYDTICVGNEFNLQRFSFIGNFDYYCGATNRVENEDEEGKEYFWKFALYNRNYDFWFDEYISCEIGELKKHGDKFYFTFQALSGVPYRLIELFAEQFKVPFTLKHIDKTGDDWGIETYEIDEEEQLRTRLTNRDWELIDLHIELIGDKPNLAMLLRQRGQELKSLLCKFGTDLETVIESLDEDSRQLLRLFGIYDY